MINSFEQARREASGGRTYDRGGVGRRVDNNTWLIDHDDRIALKFHDTNIATFFPDHVEMTGAWDSRTTIERFRKYTPFDIMSIDKTPRRYLVGDGQRVFLDGTPCNLGLAYRDGVCCTYDGTWIPPTLGEKELVALPRAGTRRAFKAAKRAFRKRIETIIQMRAGAPSPLHGTSRREIIDTLETLAEGGTVDQDDIVEIAEGLRLTSMDRLLGDIHITDTALIERRHVDVFEAEELLSRRAPEWAD